MRDLSLKQGHHDGTWTYLSGLLRRNTVFDVVRNRFLSEMCEGGLCCGQQKYIYDNVFKYKAKSSICSGANLLLAGTYSLNGFTSKYT